VSLKQPAPTPEEVVDQIEETGQKTGAWGQMGGKDTRPMFLTEQVDLARKLKSVLEQQEALLTAELQQAKEALHRIKHGGGR
jgi:hypothetical protein